MSMELEPKYIGMINQLRLTNSEEDVGNFLKAVMMHDLAKQHWEQIFKKQSDWISVDDRLPEEDNSKDVCIDNNKLFMIYWSKHKSYEFAYLTRQDGALIWCIPDHGFAELSEVTYWKPLSLIPNK